MDFLKSKQLYLRPLIIFSIGFILSKFAPPWIENALQKHKYFTCLKYPPEGHMQPIGYQWNIHAFNWTVNDWIDTIIFWDKYANVDHPLLFKKVAQRFPAFSKWTNPYLRENFGDIEIDVESNKKEDRNFARSKMTLGTFLDNNLKQSYLVDSLPLQLYGDLYLPTCLSCGNLLKAVVDIGLWMSSGGTKSVLHTDSLENIHCTLSGSKQFFLADKKYSEEIILDHPEGAYSSINVEEVDLCQNPRIKNVPWYNVTLDEGDCLYIPYKWFHQVNAHPVRSISINFWFLQIFWLNSTDCEASETENSPQALDKVKFSNDVELAKFEVISLMEGNPEVNISRFSDIFKNDVIHEDGLCEAFKILDLDDNEIVTLEELYSCDSTLFFQYFK